MSNIEQKTTLEAACSLISCLDIKHIYVFRDRMEIRYSLPNQKIIAFGSNEEELILNFYELYHSLIRPA